MSALPKAVKKHIDNANKIADDYYKALRGEQPAAPPAGEPPATPPAGEPPPASNTPPAGEPPPASNTPPATPPSNVANIPQPDAEQRYRVLQGKYNAEVPRLQTQVREQGDTIKQLRDQLTATQTLLASLSGQQASAPAGNAPPAGTPAAPKKLVQDEEIREFGADLIDVVRRAAREEIAQQVPAVVEQRVAPVAQRVDQVAQAAGSVVKSVQQNDQQSVLDLLADKVPNWTTVNEDPEFLAWLDQRDSYSGARRGDMLSQAYKAHDGPRVVAFFNGFLKEHATVTTPPPPAA